MKRTTHYLAATWAHAWHSFVQRTIGVLSPAVCRLPSAACRLPPAPAVCGLPSAACSCRLRPAPAVCRLRAAVCGLLLPSAACLLLLFSADVRGQEVVDKMVATVNGGVRTDLITYSDLLWQLALQPGTPLDNPNSQDLNRALRLVTDQRLILQEAEKLPSIAPTGDEIKNARDSLVKAFPSFSEFQQRLMRVGLTSEKLDEILEHRVRIEKYLDFRFRNFVLITQKEIVEYYQDVYVPRLRSRSPGQIVPTLEEAKGEIEKILTEAKIESDTDAFLDTARDRAEIVILSPV